MNDKEKKAIDMCRLLLNGDITLHVIDDDGGTAYAGTVNKTYNDDLQTVLNLIEKQKYIIEGKECVIETQEHNEEVYEKMLKHKDKMIDLMANNLIGVVFSDNDNKEILFDNNEDIKQYFEKKAEGNNNE